MRIVPLICLLLTSFEVLSQAKVDSTTNSSIITIAENSPHFPGGLAEMNKFLNSRLKYPKAAQRKSIEGRVVVSFVVEKDGSILPESIKVEKSVHPLLDEEAIRVTKQMPPWIPASQRGRLVRCKAMVPFDFMLR